MILPRDIELRFPHIHSVHASAGSGKTYLLSARFVQFLLSPHINAELRNTLAITFTNEATAQMKKRIINTLKKMALTPNAPDVQPIIEIISVNRQKLPKRARDKVFEILKDYSEFQVRTIDSFINSIAKSTSFELGLTSEFEIETDRDAYYQLAIDRLMEKAATDTAVRSTFMEFIQGKLTKEGGWDIGSEILKHTSKLLNQEAATGRTYHFTAGEVHNDLLKRLRGLVSEFLKQVEPYKDWFKKNAIKGFRKFVEGNDSFPQSSYFYKNSIREVVKNEAGELPPSIHDLYDEIRETAEMTAFAHAASSFHYYNKFLQLLRGEVEVLKRKNRIIFMDDINLTVRKLLADMEVPEVFFKLGERIAHFLIDEFQDTSLLQWNNLKMLIENALSEGGSLFVVGDQKQMIYRFRGSEIGIMDRVIDRSTFPSVESEAFRIFRTNYNWRSRENIVEFNNEVFSPQNLRNSLGKSDLHIEEIVSIYEDGQQDIPPSLKELRAGGFVNVIPLELDREDDHEEALKNEFMKVIGEVTGRRPLSDIVVLVRKHDEGERISGWLLEAGIPVISARSLDIRNNRLINNLIGFLKFLNMPIDNVSFSAAITGPAFLAASGLDAEALVKWLRSAKEGDRPYYRLFREDYPEVWSELIEPFFRLVGYLSTYDLLRQTIAEWRITENFPWANAFLAHLLETVHRLEEQGRGDLSSLIELIDSGSDGIFSVSFPQEFNGVRIMTMHAAKGLEFPVVIIPFVGSSKNKKDDKRPIEYRDGDQLKLLNVLKAHARAKNLKEIYEREQTHKLIDELNLLYVACTRAVDELHIIVSYEMEKNGSVKVGIARLFLGETPHPIQKGAPLRRAAASARAMEHLNINTRGIEAWQKRFVRQKISISDIKHDRIKAIKRGDLVHGALARIRWLPDSEDEINSAISKALETEIKLRGWKSFLSEIKDISEQVTYALIDSGAIRWFRDAGGDTVATEYEVVDRWGKTFRLDRIVFRKNLIEIVEFKTGEEYTDEHITQVKRYENLIRSIYPQKRVKSYLFYIDESVVRELPESLI